MYLFRLRLGFLETKNIHTASGQQWGEQITLQESTNTIHIPGDDVHGELLNVNVAMSQPGQAPVGDAAHSIVHVVPHGVKLSLLEEVLACRLRGSVVSHICFEAQVIPLTAATMAG